MGLKQVPLELISVKIDVAFRYSSNESKNYDCTKLRMKICTKQIKPYRKQRIIAKIITVSLSLIKFSVTIVYIGRS